MKMEEFDNEEQVKKKSIKVSTFPVPLASVETKEYISTSSKYSKEKIINQAFMLHSQGNISEAAKYYQDFINKGLQDHRVLSNYGTILKDLGKLQEAENLYRKAIDFNPYYAEAYSNLGIILSELDKLEEAEISFRKAIKIKPEMVNAHLNLGNILQRLGKLSEAESSTLKALKLNSNLPEAYYNLGSISTDLLKLKDAAEYFLKALTFKPNFVFAHYNLGNVLKDLGRLKDSELSLNKAIEIDPDFAKAYYVLSSLKYSDKNKNWRDKLFLKDFIRNKSIEDKIDIYFARSNILHRENKYLESAKYLQLANNLKLEVNPYKLDFFLNKSKLLLSELDNKSISNVEKIEDNQSIFIVGMPRSGSTLLESILSMNNNVDDLGEINILEESFLESKVSDRGLFLAESYLRKVRQYSPESKITTNKCLYNYQYAGIISSQIPNSKIIHCCRNPLDNILSIYRAHFSKGNEYSSSLLDCVKVYLDQEEIMSQYKNRFRSKIYDLNYDSLVSNPKDEIRSLISWIGWDWNDIYLSPHLSHRAVSTRSSVQVRFPINSKSIGGWKHYEKMLQPAIEILKRTNKYRDVIF